MLQDYQVSPTHGFLPSIPPLAQLPEYYREWEAIGSDLYGLRIRDELTAKVQQLPLLGADFLTHEPEWRRAFVLLGFIAHAYIWGPLKPLEVRPEAIGISLELTY